mgnify:CR=1 FL=1
MQVSDGHLWAALQQGQSLPDALIDISAFEACVIADAAANGTTTRLKASSAAKMDRMMRIGWTLMPAAVWRQFTALCIFEADC